MNDTERLKQVLQFLGEIIFGSGVSHWVFIVICSVLVGIYLASIIIRSFRDSYDDEEPLEIVEEENHEEGT